MPSPSDILDEQSLGQLRAACTTLVDDTAARAVVICDTNGQVLSGAGELLGLDVSGLASLGAGAVAAATGLAALLGEPHGFSQLSYEGRTQSLHVARIGTWAILWVSYDCYATLGLVRLETRRCCDRLTSEFSGLFAARELHAEHEPARLADPVFVSRADG